MGSAVFKTVERRFDGSGGFDSHPLPKKLPGLASLDAGRVNLSQGYQLSTRTTHRAAFVYLLRCADGTIYTGWTFNVPRRVRSHQSGRGARYTRSRLPVTLIYQERCRSQADAMRREALIKRWPRHRKLELAGNKPLVR